MVTACLPESAAGYNRGIECIELGGMRYWIHGIENLENILREPRRRSPNYRYSQLKVYQRNVAGKVVTTPKITTPKITTPKITTPKISLLTDGPHG